MTCFPADESPVVVCQDLCIGYDGKDVVHDVSLEIRTGTLLPFVGPNGAGKTTLLRTILGLLTPRSGTLLTDFGGRPPGYVPQHRVIDPLLPISTRQLVCMGLYPELGFWRRPSRTQWRRIDEWLGRFGLAGHEAKAFAALSGGMKQKTLVVRALVSGAQVFVMDEPTSELDGDSERDLMRCLHDMSRRGKTVLIAHHGLNGLTDFASEVCLMEHGRARIVPLTEATETANRRFAERGLQNNG